MGLPALALLVAGLGSSIATFIAAGVITISLIQTLSAIITHIGEGQLDSEDLEQVQKAQEQLDKYLKSLFDFREGDIANGRAIPLSDILVPSKSGPAYRVPVKLGGGLKGGSEDAGRFVWMRTPPVIGKDPDGNVIFTFPPGWKKFPWIPPRSDVPEFCGPPWKPWFPGAPPDGSGPAGGLPICAAAGHFLDAPAIVYNSGLAGDVTIRDWTSQGIFHIRKFMRSGTVTVVNETDEVFVLGDPFTKSAVSVDATHATHGGALATSMYCFPGQEFQLGGVSTGAGIEVFFRISAWHVPRKTDVDPALVAKVTERDPRLQLYMLDSGPSNLVAYIHVFLDVPWSGKNKINVEETTFEQLYVFPDECDRLTARYSKLEEVDHVTEGSRYRAKFRFPKGENGVGRIVIAKK